MKKQLIPLLVIAVLATIGCAKQDTNCLDEKQENQSTTQQLALRSTTVMSVPTDLEDNDAVADYVQHILQNPDLYPSDNAVKQASSAHDLIGMMYAFSMDNDIIRDVKDFVGKTADVYVKPPGGASSYHNQICSDEEVVATFHCGDGQQPGPAYQALPIYDCNGGDGILYADVIVECTLSNDHQTQLIRFRPAYHN